MGNCTIFGYVRLADNPLRRGSIALLTAQISDNDKSSELME